MNDFSFFINNSSIASDDLVRRAVDDMVRSGLYPETLEKAMVRIFSDKVDILKARLGRSNLGGQSILQVYRLIEFPYFNKEGKVVLYRYKLIPSALDKDGREIKYLHPENAPAIPYILPDIWDVKDKTHKPIWITEGEKKALKLVQHERHAIGLSGVWNFKAGIRSTEKESRELWLELKEFDWRGRTVFLAFDNDLWVNSNVRYALYELAFKLYAKDAIVRIALWTNEKGIDDYLVSKELIGKSVDEVLTTIEQSSIELMGFITPSSAHPNELIRAIAYSDVDGIRCEQIIREIKDKFKIPLAVLRTEINRKRREVENEIDEYEDLERSKICQELCGLNYLPLIPPGFDIIDKTLYEIKIIKDIEIKIPISNLFAIESSVNSENSKMILKSIYNRRLMIDLAISDTKNFDVEISNFLRQPFTKDTIKALQKYVQDFHGLNRGKMPVFTGMDKTGWIKDVFYLPTREYENIIWENETLIRAITTNGNREQQLELLKKILKTPAGICVLAGLSAPLLRILDIPNYIVNLTGLPKMGKSTVAWFNASLWGNPLYLKGSWFSTKVGFELFAATWRDMPVWLDEFESAGKEVSNVVDFMYQYHQGFGKLRGTKDLHIKAQREFNGVFITTSEKDIDSIISRIKNIRTIPRGIFRRVIEVPIDEESFNILNSDEKLDLPEINRFAYKNYGWFAKEWVEFIEKNIDKVTETYNGFYNSLTTIGMIKGMESSYGIILTVCRLLDKFLDTEVINSDGEQAGSLLMGWIHDELITKQSETMESVEDITSEFLNQLRDVVFSNKDKFIGMNTLIKQRASIGFVDGEETTITIDATRTVWGEVINDKDVFILVTAFKDEICNKYGFVKNQVLGEFKKKDLLKISSAGVDSKHSRFRHRISGKPMWGYYFKDVFEKEDFI